MKKGFTLIELLAVIIILGIIGTITVISVNSVINSSKKSLSETQIKNIEEAAKVYYLKEGMTVNDTDACVNIEELINKGYIEGNSIIDPNTNKEISGSVRITYASNQYNYEYQKNSCE